MEDVDTGVLDIFGEERVHENANLVHVDEKAEVAKLGVDGDNGKHEARVKGAIDDGYLGMGNVF